MSRAAELLARVEQLKLFGGSKSFDVVELFAGAGGAGLGLHRAGFGRALMVEYNPTAAETLRAAVKEGRLTGKVIEGDVRNVDYRKLEGVRLLWASWPCQPFSTAGKGEGAWDERNGWPWTLKAMDECLPKYFAGENVTGLLRHVSGCRKTSNPRDCAGCYTERVILADLRLRFKWAAKWVLNAADFGVPQIRNRVFFVAGPHPVLRPRPTHANPYPQERKPGETKKASAAKEAARLNNWEREGMKSWLTMGDVLDRADPWEKLEPMYWGVPESQVLKRHGVQRLEDLSPELLAEYEGRHDDWYCTHCKVSHSSSLCLCPDPEFAESMLDRPAPTISGGTERGHVGGGSILSATASTRNDLHWALKRYDPTKPFPGVTPEPERAPSMSYEDMREMLGWDPPERTTYLGVTVDEVKVLMGFPADWPLAGSNQRKYRQLGNAVVPRVAELVGEAILQSEKLFSKGWTPPKAGRRR